MICLALLAMVPFLTARADNPKREFRSAWITTVWAIDWPNQSWGSASRAAQQQAELIQLLDSLKAANMNAACFQVRGFCDAMYNSKYEPWSKYLTGERGGVPSYDPLALAVTEAHNRGMELHVWLNPYRYASSSDTYGNLSTDYSQTHPEWLMTVGGATILNPGLPEVRHQICAVVADILEKYDVDGVLFDDYFYLSGTAMSVDAELYRNNNPQGLSQADWRRENVNMMVEAVRDTILATKPWVTFGIGPAPQVAHSQAVADQYEVDVFPYNDWQYNSIYSDPLAWVSRGLIDYVSPQIYYQLGSTYDFAVFSAWWSKTSNQFGRHFYASHTVEKVGTSTCPVTETSDQIAVLRSDDRNSAPGSVFYSIRHAVYTPNFIRNLRNTVYSTPALPPMKSWREQNNPLFVSNINYSNGTLTWTAPASNLRYAVYCIPTNYATQHNIFSNPQYLVGMTYTNSMKVPLRSNYTYAVAVLDRYGNEYPPLVRNASMRTLTAPVLETPANGVVQIVPSTLRWHPAAGADSYLLEVATDAAFAHRVTTYETADTAYFTGKLAKVENGATYFWRVRARGANGLDAISAPFQFTAKVFSMLAPADGTTEVELAPQLRCDSIEQNGVSYVFEIARSRQFDANNFVYKDTALVPHIQLPEQVLMPGTTYYVRATAYFADQVVPAEATYFRTLVLPVPVPEIVSPVSGDTVTGPNVTVVWKEQNANSFKAELSTYSSFAPRFTQTVKTDAYQHEATFEQVAEGDYYLRVQANSENGWLASQVVTLYVVTQTGVNNLSDTKVYVADGTIFAEAQMSYALYSMSGECLTVGTTQVGATVLPKLGQGVYVLKVGAQCFKVIL